MKSAVKQKTKEAPKARSLELVMIGEVSLVAPPHEAQSGLIRAQVARAEAAMAAGRADECRRLVERIEQRLGVTTEERLAARQKLEPWEVALEAALPGAVAKARHGAAAKVSGKVLRKRGRKVSGLRDLSPEAAQLVVAGWSVSAVREAVDLQKRVRTMGRGEVPNLDRILRGDLAVERIMESEYSHLRLRPVLKARTPRDLLTSIGVDQAFADVAEGFLADIEGARIGKLTASYGEGLGGGRAGEPERVATAIISLVRSQAKLTAKQRLALWGLLVFGLPIQDIGWMVAGDKFGDRREALHTAAVLFVEGALEALLPVYRRRAERA